MPEPEPLVIEDEIDLRNLVLTLWRGKYIIFLISVLSVALASIYLRHAEKKYFIKADFKPVVEASGMSPNLARLSGLASLSGVSLPVSSSSDFATYQKLIFSEEVAERVFTNRDLIVRLFNSEWNADVGSFEEPFSGKVGKLKESIRTTLTGFEIEKYVPPNPKRLSMLMAAELELSLNSVTGFLSISTETSQPDIMLSLIHI